MDMKLKHVEFTIFNFVLLCFLRYLPNSPASQMYVH